MFGDSGILKDLLWIAVAAFAAWHIFGFVRKFVGNAYHYDMLDDMKLIVCILEGICAVGDIVVASFTYGDYIIHGAVGIVVVFTAIYTLMGKKKLGMPTALIVGAIQSVCCLFVGLALLVLGSSGGSYAGSCDEGDGGTGTGADVIMKADMQRLDYTARQQGYTDANDWAASSGYSSAEEAYKSGFFNGK